MKQQHKTLNCELYLHMKHTQACISLRGKRICRRNCKEFFNWVKEKEEVVKEALLKYEKPIRHYLKYKDPYKALKEHTSPSGEVRARKTIEDLMANVMPKGDIICDFCGRPYSSEKRLQLHIRKKHRRVAHEKKSKQM